MYYGDELRSEEYVMSTFVSQQDGTLSRGKQKLKAVDKAVCSSSPCP